MKYSFCPKCGSQLHTRLIDRDEHLVCSSCAFIFYQNSKPCVGALILDRDRLLLVQRAIEPFKGDWDIPGGFLKAGEHPEAGIIRETQEETGLLIKPGAILEIYIDKTYGQIEQPTLTIYYLAEVASGQAQARHETVQVQWFALDSLPENIVSNSLREALKILQIDLT